jgi:squalene-hopene/tetraprenyl-beta-curcumene cyclase
MLALFGFIPWQAVPVIPVEVMLLPTWFPFHLDKISYWSRTVIVPLLVLMVMKPRAHNAKGVRIDELFVSPPQSIGPTPKAPQQKASWFWFFRGVDNVLRAAEPFFPKSTRQRAIDSAVAWATEHLNGEDGLGAIFPAMANSVMMFAVLGYAEDHPLRAIARKSIEKLLVVHDNEAYCQPCVSPIWDTGLTCHALLEVGGERAVAQVERGLDWLVPKQILDVRGDWIARRPDTRPGGWAFQYANAHYPDVDDTAPANGSSACRARTAPGAPSMPTTNIIISTTFRSPITARCLIRRPRTSPRAACRCSRSSARPRRPARRWRAASTICAGRNMRKEAGTAAGA